MIAHASPDRKICLIHVPHSHKEIFLKKYTSYSAKYSYKYFWLSETNTTCVNFNLHNDKGNNDFNKNKIFFFTSFPIFAFNKYIIIKMYKESS